MKPHLRASLLLASSGSVSGVADVPPPPPPVDDVVPKHHSADSTDAEEKPLPSGAATPSSNLITAPRRLMLRHVLPLLLLLLFILPAPSEALRCYDSNKRMVDASDVVECPNDEHEWWCFAVYHAISRQPHFDRYCVKVTSCTRRHVTNEVGWVEASYLDDTVRATFYKDIVKTPEAFFLANKSIQLQTLIGCCNTDECNNLDESIVYQKFGKAPRPRLLQSTAVHFPFGLISALFSCLLLRS